MLDQIWIVVMIMVVVGYAAEGLSRARRALTVARGWSTSDASSPSAHPFPAIPPVSPKVGEWGWRWTESRCGPWQSHLKGDRLECV